MYIQKNTYIFQVHKKAEYEVFHIIAGHICLPFCVCVDVFLNSFTQRTKTWISCPLRGS